MFLWDSSFELNLHDVDIKLEILLVLQGPSGVGLTQIIDPNTGVYTGAAGGGAAGIPLNSAANSQSSPGSNNSLHSLSPPVSPYDAGPPPTYQQHLNMVNRKRMLPTDDAANANSEVQVCKVLFIALGWGEC